MEFSIKIISSQIIHLQFSPQINTSLLAIIQTIYLYCKNELQNEVSDVIPAYNSIMVKTSLPITKNLKEQIYKKIKQIISENNVHGFQKDIIKKIPVCYDARLGLDQNRFLEHANCSLDELINMHCQPEYIVYMVGFLPGFAYMGVVPEKLRLPRLNEPRKIVPQGSVAIANQQTGIYPFTSPGGWNIIGQTPLKMFNIHEAEPTYLKMGDRVKFCPISIDEFEDLI